MKRFFGLAKLVVGFLSLLVFIHNAQPQTGPGTALQFNGTNAYVWAPAALLSNKGLTVEAWVKPTNLTLVSQQVIVWQGSNGPTSDFLFSFEGYGTVLSFISLASNGATPTDLIITVPINPNALQDGNWHHLAATYAPTNCTRTLYLDGANLGVSLFGVTYPSAMLGGGVAIGAISNAPSTGGLFAGGIDEVRVWTTNRSAAQICQTLNQRLVGNEPRLAAYWRLDEGTGTTTSDSSGHGLTGTLINDPAWIASAALQAVPSVTTTAATSITHTSAVLTGSSIVCGLATSAWFEYGTNTNYGQTTSPQNVGGGTQPATFVQTVTNLTPDTIYHFRAVALNSGGVGRGADQQFKTAGQPKPVTLPLVANTFTSATLQATIDPDGLGTTAGFQWGSTTNYGSSTPPQLLTDSNSVATVVQPISIPVPGQTYHYRAIATNIAGTGFGQDQFFLTGFSNAFAGNKFIARGTAAWGDYDGDGILDLLVTGDDQTNGHAHIYRTDGRVWSPLPDPSGNPATSAGLVGVRQGAGVWGDFDNDGALDVLLTGYTNWYFYYSGPTTRIHRNTKGMFTNLVAEFTGVWRSCAAAADYNNDGFLDFVVSGVTNTSLYDPPTGQTNILYRNNGDGTFTPVPTALPAVFDGAVAWGDFDNDGQLDLAIMGNTGESNITRIYRNDQGVFTDIGANLPGLSWGSLAWGDYDNDGQLDLLLTGSLEGEYGTPICRIYRNNNGTFTDIGAGLPGSSHGIATWGDFDGDGYLDILFTHGLNPTYNSRLYRNDHGLFTDVQAGLPGFQYSSGAWGDYDSDGRLDFVLIGYDSIQVPYVYRSFVTPATNPFAPLAPSGLASVVQSNGVILNWGPGTDAHTPALGLTYNVRVTPAAGPITLSPGSEPVTGRRRVPQMGNAEHRLFTVLTNLPVGLYFCSVQTVNNSFAGSPWAPDQTFAITSGPPVVTTLLASNILGGSALLSGTVTPGGQPAHAWFEWGTTSNLGSAMPAFDVGTGLLLQLVSKLLTNLQARTTYFFRFAASNEAGIAFGTNQVFTTLGPVPATSTVGASNVTYTSALLFGACARSSPTADYFIEWGLTTSYGNLAIGSVTVPALRFDGVNDFVGIGWGKFPQVTNNFTMELWANPTGGRSETPEVTGGGWGTSGQRYAIFPDIGTTAYTNGVHAGAGISIGANGVSVMEHTDNYMPAVLVYTGSLSGWTHVALVYSNHVPRLYLNGAFVRSGLTGLFPVHPSTDLGGTTNFNYGYFEGALQEVRIWDLPLDGGTIQAWMDRSLATNHPAYSHLQGYWPLNEGQGTIATDYSPRTNSGRLLNGPSWNAAGWMTNAQTFGAALAGLTPGTTYHFRAVATNSGGTAYGSDQTFTTLPRPQVLDFSAQPGPSYLLRSTGTSGMSYIVEASTNLTFWIALSNLSAGPDGLFDFLDTSATNLATRFYRIRAP